MFFFLSCCKFLLYNNYLFINVNMIVYFVKLNVPIKMLPICLYYKCDHDGAFSMTPS